MARSPYVGTFRQNARPTVVMAPDALVYLNGETDIIGCPKCKRRFNLNKYITTIQVDLSVDSVPGSATINLSIPRHTVDDFYFDGTPIVMPMMEVEIYMKGYFLVEGIPQYYPVFWGLITEVGEAYSAGEHTVTLQCADILKWWELCKMNINPAYVGSKPTQMGWSIFGNVLFGKNPYDLIWTLAQNAFGDIVQGSGSLVSMYKEQSQQATFTAGMADMMIYWEERFSRMRSNLLLYGTNGIAVRGADLAEFSHDAKGKLQGLASSAVAVANGGVDAVQMVFDPTDPGVTAFRTQGTQAGQLNLWQSEYQTKLEIANACKEVAGFEFFMDVSGDIVFKPPFYNLDIIGNKPVSWIQDIDIIDWDFSESEAEVITQVVMQGNYTGNTDWGLPEECTPFTAATDYHLLKRYGWRSENYNSEFMGDPQMMFYHGLDILDRKNSRRHRGTVTIPIRPELRLGFPIYIAPKDQIWYIQGISHNITFGGRAQTQLNLTAKRSKFIAPKGIATLKMTGMDPAIKPLAKIPSWSPFKYTSKQISKGAAYELKLTSTSAAEIPPQDPAILNQPWESNPYAPLILRHPKTGRILGYPNVVMVYKRPFKPSPEQLGKVQGRSAKSQYTSPQEAQKAQAQQAAVNAKTYEMYVANPDDSIRERYHTNRFSYGLNSAGVYVYAHDATDGVKIGEFALIPAARLKATQEDEEIKGAFKTQSAMVRPVSDERGFEVIGHFRYGRGLCLRDGRLIWNEGQVNQAAAISTQLPLTGQMFETLEAQSQGLTTVQTMYASPGETVAKLQPEDLQTGATIDPTTGKASFSQAYGETGTNFVDTAPLGSPEQQGVPQSVEASQLSRALTLAEMTILEDPYIDVACDCIFSRSDLAFINTGFTVQFLAGGQTTPDTAAIPRTTTVTGSVTDLTQPVAQSTIAVQAPADALNKVDQYLFSLYKALDAPHQVLEAALRGELLYRTRAADGYNPDDSGPYGGLSPLAPPFSAPGRYALGDPAAAGAMGSSAVESLTQTWEDFANDLKETATTTYLTQTIANNEAAVDRLEDRLGDPGSDDEAIQDLINQKNQQTETAKAILATGKPPPPPPEPPPGEPPPDDQIGVAGQGLYTFKP